MDASLTSDNLLRLRNNVLERSLKLIITINYNIRDEKLQYDINKEAPKISELSSTKIDKYEYLTGEEMLPSYQSRKIAQTKFIYSRLRKI